MVVCYMSGAIESVQPVLTVGDALKHLKPVVLIHNNIDLNIASVDPVDTPVGAVGEDYPNKVHPGKESYGNRTKWR